FLKGQALEVVNRCGELEQIPSHGIGRAYSCPAFRIWYAHPETSECDEFHHLEVWAEQGKVLSVVWLPDQAGNRELQTWSMGGVFPYIANGYKAEFIGQDVTKESV